MDVTLLNFTVGGVPIILIVFACVEEVKAWGLTGKILRGLALALGIAFAVTFQLAFLGLPVNAEQWYTLVVVGLIYGLSASGAYNFLDARFPKEG
jgi:hypothetical protein